MTHAQHTHVLSPVALQVPISSELGCVTPWLVVPGEWSEKELTHQSRALAEGIAPACWLADAGGSC